MKNKLRVYVVGSQKDYADWLPNYTLVPTLAEADLVMFTGGEDVSPSLYNEPMGAWTYRNLSRDLYEQSEFKKALERGLPMIGICRGSQLLCVLSGGRLVQDQQNPHFYHDIITSDGRKVMISSTHHQAQYPYDMPKDEYEVLAWTEGLSKRHLNGLNEEISDKPFKEVEICYYPKTRALGIQGHPEYMTRDRYPETFAYLDELLEKLLTPELV